MKNVILCGFMGCGKTTVGKRLAPMLGYSFVDMDRYIEQQAGKRISDIFSQDGEDAFRQLEHDACVTLGRESGLVIATGGGAVLRADNAAALKANGMIVWLRIRPETVLARLQGDTSRPLLQRPDKETAVRTLLTQREPLYQAAADFSADADDLPLAVTQAVRRLLPFS